MDVHMVACGGWLSLDTAQVLCSFVCVLDAMAGGVQFGGCWLHPPQWRFEGYAPPISSNGFDLFGFMGPMQLWYV